MKLAFVHISGSRKGQTDVVEERRFILGTHASCNIRFSAKEDRDVQGFHVEITSGDGRVFLRDIGGDAKVYVDRKIVREAELTDGNLIGIGVDGPTVCVRFVDKKDVQVIPPPTPPHRQDSERPPDGASGIHDTPSATSQQQSGGRKHDLLNIIFKDFVQRPHKKRPENIRNILAIVVVLAAGVSFALYYFYFYKLKETSKRLQILESQQSFVENVIEEYRKGVCFIQGNYYFVDGVTGEPLLVHQDGTPAMNHFTGTGFVVDNDGIILTNRHVAEPDWRGSDHPSEDVPDKWRSSQIRFEVLRAFFPEIEDAFPLEIVGVSEDADVAMLSFKPDGTKLPVLGMDVSGKRVRIGEPVILLGYPAGINAMFGKTRQDVVDELITLPITEMVDELARRNLIRPLVTQGHVTDITPDRIIYDAQTTVGGSGGPLINISGRVIGVNYGILRSFKGSNFAVPVEYGIDLLEKENISRPLGVDNK